MEEIEGIRLRCLNIVVCICTLRGTEASAHLYRRRDDVNYYARQLYARRYTFHDLVISVDSVEVIMTFVVRLYSMG